MTDLVAELRTLLGVDAVLGPADVALRARNYWDPAPLEALALVRPRSTLEVSQVMALCDAHDQTVVVHGGLTGVCDADRATMSDVVISFERMTAIEEIDVIGRTATVQAGCRLQALQSAVEAAGLFFPLDLGGRGSCTVGGNVATNAGGTTVIRFGMMRALVLGLEAVLPEGTVVSSMNRMLKNNTGYDVKQLFIGSEGTLGIVTRVVVTLKEQPVSANTVLVALKDGKQLAPLLKLMDRRLGGTMSSFEAMWGDYFRAVTTPGWHAAPMAREHAFYVIIEAQGPDQEDDARRFNAAIEQAYEAQLIVDAVLPKSNAERARIWAIREDFEALRQHKPLLLYDVSLPLKDMLAYVDEVTRGLKALWPASEFFALGHIGDGNLHFFVAPEAAGDAGAASARAVPASVAHTGALHAACDEVVYRPLARFQGAVSAEHGIGLEKKAWMPVSRSPTELELMRRLKRCLDPKGLLNRGKVIDA
jgi:FAD/FMN-containing dehydrogenase